MRRLDATGHLGIKTWTPCDVRLFGSDPARPYRRRKAYSKSLETTGKNFQQLDLPA
jgi:hypothetical protein